MQAEADLTFPEWMNWHALPIPLKASDFSLPTTRKLTPSESVPCRRCLRNTVSGEDVYLLSYDPFPQTPAVHNPYHTSSPVFVHAHECDHFDQDREGHIMPKQQQGRMLSVRAFDAGHIMIKTDLAEGKRVLELCTEWLRDAKVKFVHLHYARYGCFGVQVDRKIVETGKNLA